VPFFSGEGNTNCMEYLLSNGAQMNQIVNGTSAFMCAAGDLYFSINIIYGKKILFFFSWRIQRLFGNSHQQRS